MKPSKAQIKELTDLHNSDLVKSERLMTSYMLDDSRIWVDPRGYKLSDRVWLAGRDVRAKIDDTLRLAIANGTDALVVADSLEQWLAPSLRPIRDAAGEFIPGQAKRIVTSTPKFRAVMGSTRPQMGSYSARRLVRTEITRAFGQATEWAAARTPFALGVRWSTSGRHPKSDQCDEHAERNSGLGPGVYPIGQVPTYPAHPHCLCVLSQEVERDTEKVVRDLRAQYRLDEP